MWAVDWACFECQPPLNVSWACFCCQPPFNVSCSLQDVYVSLISFQTDLIVTWTGLLYVDLDWPLCFNLDWPPLFQSELTSIWTDPFISIWTDLLYFNLNWLCFETTSCILIWTDLPPVFDFGLTVCCIPYCQPLIQHCWMSGIVNLLSSNIIECPGQPHFNLDHPGCGHVCVPFTDLDCVWVSQLSSWVAPVSLHFLFDLLKSCSQPQTFFPPAGLPYGTKSLGASDLWSSHTNTPLCL